MEIKPNEIYLGSCYDLIKEMADNSVDCIYTDVPYDYGYQSRDINENASSVNKRICKMREALLADNIANGFDFAILDDFVRVMKKINIFIWCSKQQILPLMKYFIEEKGCVFEILTWNKTNPAPMTSNTWLSDIEYCLYFRENGVKLNDGYELKSKWFTDKCNKVDKDKFEHPTIKPEQLVERHLKHATQPNDIIFDPFLGSGTTAVAAKNTGRRYIGMEILEKYYKIASDRLNNTEASGQMTMFTF